MLPHTQQLGGSLHARSGALLLEQPLASLVPDAPPSVRLGVYPMTIESVGEGSQHHPFTPRHDFHYKLRYFSKLHTLPAPTKSGGSQTYQRTSPPPPPPPPHQTHHYRNHYHHQPSTKTNSVTPPWDARTTTSSHAANPLVTSLAVLTTTADKISRRKDHKKNRTSTLKKYKHSSRASRPIRIPSRLSPAEEQEAAQLRGSRLRCRLRPRHVPMAIVKAGEAVAAACTRPESSLCVPDLPPSPSCEPWLWADDAMTVTLPVYESSSSSSSSSSESPSSSYSLSATTSGSEDSESTSCEDNDEDAEDEEEEGKEEIDQGDEELQMGFNLEM